MKKYVEDEIEQIQAKIDDLTEKLSLGQFSTFGAGLAAQAVATLTEIHDFLKNEDSPAPKVDAIITRMPLLYITISKIN